MRRVLVLAALAAMVAMATAPASAYNAPGPRWPGHTIRYSDTLPKSWNETIRQAVQTWNRSGVKMRFVRAPRSRAQVNIGYGDANGYDGYASIGRTPAAYVQMNRSVYKPLDPDQRVPAAKVLTHELGHVLGLDHVKSTKCHLMSVPLLVNCPQPPESWLYDCSWLSKDDVRGALHLYGGRARKPTRSWCPLEPQPAAPQDVRFLSGDPVRVTWTPPKAPRAGTEVAVYVYDQSRCQGNQNADSLDVDSVPAGRGQWADSGYREAGTYCYEVRAESAHGRVSATTQGLATFTPTPPAAPVVGALVEYPDDTYDYAVTADVPEDATLHVDVSDSGQCTTTPRRFNHVDWGEGNTWFLTAIPEGPVCLSFYSIGRVPSAVVTREVVHAPRL